MEFLTAEEVYEIWAPRSAVWSPWVPPVFFMQVKVANVQQSSSELNRAALDWFDGARTAVILDLPDGLCVRYAMALADRGFRPVPLFNSSPAPAPLPAPLEAVDLIQSAFQHDAPTTMAAARSFVTLEMDKLTALFAAATHEVRRLVLPPDAPPAFMLDGMRLKGHHAAIPSRYDNRWMVFPQDFPSARFLREHKIDSALVVVNDHATIVQDDLAHVLLRWQEQGIAIWKKSLVDHGAPKRITVHRPSRFRALWYRALAMLGFRRNSAGGFGSVIPQESSGGGGFG